MPRFSPSAGDPHSTPRAGSRVRRACPFGMLFAVLAFATPATVLAAKSPTTDTQPFRKIDLYGDRSATVNVSEHVNISQYPSSVSDTSLLAIRSGTDSVGIFRSYPYDAINLKAQNIGDQSYLEFSVTPPRYATMVGVLAMATNVFDGSGAFADLGKTDLTVKVTYADNDSFVSTLDIGNRIRHWTTGSNCSSPYYTVGASNPLSGRVWSGSGYFYDVHEFSLPPDKRDKKVTRVRIAAVRMSHFCSAVGISIYGGGRLHGISVGPNFQMVNRAGTSVSRQSQGDPAWRDSTYGGYRWGGVVVGGYHTIGAKGCFMSCVSMAHNFYGVVATPLTLCSWLQQNRGFQRNDVTQIVAVRGQAVGDTVSFVNLDGDPPSLSDHDTFLIEHGVYSNPVATLKVLTDPDSTGQRLAKITGLHGSADTIRVGDHGYMFRYPIHALAAETFGSHAWRLTPIAEDANTAANIEAALVDSMPVMVHGRVVGNVAHHWIVADGMQPYYVATGNQHRGTYSIKDPGYQAFKLTQAPHGNRFKDARVCTRLVASPAPPSGPGLLAATSASPGVLAIELSGPATLEISDPIGRTISYDPVEDTYVGDIPGVIATRSWVYDDVVDSTLDSAPADVVEISGALGGNYSVSVTGQGSGLFGLQAGGLDVSGTPSAAFQSGGASTGSSDSYRVSYSPSGAGGVSMVKVPTTDVGETRAPIDFGLAIAPNPTTGGCRFTYRLIAPGEASLAIYDLQGRTVANVSAGALPAGVHYAEWNGRGLEDRSVKAGVYFARLVVGSKVAVRRIVVAR